MPDPSAEDLTQEERARLAPFFTNVDRPVFGLRLPQEVAGALFSRYSRSAKPLRRVFLDEFADAAGLAAGPEAEAPGAALSRARAFYDRVLVGYGDDSVAQLGGAHVACERISNVAAKLLEDGRVGIAYLEKSTRYVRFDQRDAAGHYLFHKEARILASRFCDDYLALMSLLFGTYARQMEPMIELIKSSLPIEGVELRHPRTGAPMSYADTAGSPELRKSAERAYLATVRAHACDVLRSYLPGATLTNVGVFASGQAYEHLLDKLYSQPLAEGRELAGAIHGELGTLIPSFVKRAAPSDYLRGVDGLSAGMAARIPAASGPSAAGPLVTLVDHDPDAEERILAALLYTQSARPLPELRAAVRAMPPAERQAALDAFVSARRHRRDKPGRAFEHVSYTFDVLANFGIYRDLQRHRLLTQERQAFTTAHGYDTPPEMEEAGFAPAFHECMARAHDLVERLAREMPLEAQYAVPFAYRVRWYLKLDLREAVFLCELRSMPQGHPDYRAVVQEMWRRIEAVHPSLAGAAKFLNRETYRLGRLQSEMRTEYKRSQAGDR